MTRGSSGETKGETVGNTSLFGSSSLYLHNDAEVMGGAVAVAWSFDA
jgi:hypothetical protein